MTTITALTARRRSHVRHESRIRLLALAVALALTAISAVGASAATVRPMGRTPVRTVERAVSRAELSAQGTGCYWRPVKPFFLMKNSDKMYSQGQITSCTKPPPSACKMDVELFAASNTIHGPFAVGWTGNAGPTNHWVGCKKLTVNTNAFTCTATPGQNQFYTQIAAWEQVGTKILTGVWDSAKVGYHCFV